MTKQSYYKEAQTVLKQYKVAGYTTVKLNASREVLDESLRAIVSLHPNLDWETVFFYPETALEILKTVQIEEETRTEDKAMTTQSKPTKLKWHKPEPKHPGIWEAQYKKAYADNSYDNATATITIEKDDNGWFFSSSEEWDSRELNGILGYKTLKECKQKALEAVEVDIWTSEAAEAEADPDYLRFKAEAITMNQEYLDSWAA